jgi:fimbrial isopeptide formation D2 family protein/LPXTG-motif cell wall-anchored protein
MKNTNRHGRVGRVTAAIGALTLGLLGAVAFAAPAGATDGPNIDPKKTGSISLHKLVQPAEATGLPHDGTKLTDEQLKGLQPLEDVTFQLQRVSSIDLSENDGWLAVKDLTADKVLADPTAYPLVDAGSKKTDAKGELSFGDLVLGVYLVTETDPGANPIAQPAAPFLVTIPLSTGENTWLYDVHAYPKNSLTQVDKTVDDSAAYGLGDKVDWTISAKVPNFGEQALTKFAIEDALDARLAYASAAVSLTVGGADVPLAAGDFVLDAPAAGVNGKVTVTFTADGLDVLTANEGGTVTVKLATTVLSIGDGSIENVATVFVNDSGHDADAVTNWGGLKIFKFAKVHDVKKGLAGADFQIFTSEADAIARNNPVTVNTVSTFTSPADGTITVAGLKVGDYWVVETKAPVGYQADATPHAVTVTVGTVDGAVVLQVENTQVPEWMLPLTGGNGAAMFGVAGGGLVAMAIGAAFVIARRKVRA